MLDVVLLRGLYYWGLRLHPKSCNFCLDSCESLFCCQMVGFNPIPVEVLVVEGFFKILINLAEVAFEDFSDILQLTANTAG